MKIGAKLPHTGAKAIATGVATLARQLEQAGFDSLWVSDHLVFPRVIESYYPFAADGRASWPADTPYIEALTALATAAAVTESVQLGTAVLVPALRNPVLLAKQAASIDTLSHGRLRLGLGAGWLREEFEALNMSFEDRGPRMVEWMTLLRDCWTGEPAASSSDRYTLPANTLIMPPPPHQIPLYVGGHSPVALRRAGRLGDGWLAQQDVAELDPMKLRSEIEIVHRAAASAQRNPAQIAVVLRLVGSTKRTGEIASSLAALAAVGVDEIIVDADFADGDPAAEAARLHDAASAL